MTDEAKAERDAVVRYLRKRAAEEMERSLNMRKVGWHLASSKTVVAANNLCNASYEIEAGCHHEMDEG